MALQGLAVRDFALTGSIAGLVGAAFVLIAGRLVFWTRHLLGRRTGDPAGMLAASRRRLLLLEMVACLAASVGLLGTFLEMRSGARPAEARRLAPALAGLGVFIVCQGALGLFRSWSETLRTDPVLVPPTQSPTAPAPPVGGDAIPPSDTASPAVSTLPRATDAVPPAPRPRRPVPRPVRPSASDSFRQAAVLVACMIGSILLHSAVLFVAHRVQTAAPAASPPEREGVFLASIVSLPRESAPDVREDSPPPPKPPDPPPPEPPKAEAVEASSAAERAKADPPADQVRAEPPPPPPPATAEAKEPEPPTKSADVERAKAAGAPPPPPPARVTESPVAEKEPGGPPAPGAAPPAAESAPPKSGAPPVLGHGAGEASDSGAAGISTMKEYRRFLAREMKSGASDARYLPNLRFGDNKAQENREIMRYFGMELIAYPKNQKFYVYIDPDQQLFSRSNDFTYIKGFSNRAIFRTSPYFDTLRAEAARRVGVPTDSLVVAQLLKPSSAAYIGWKEAECARRAGVSLDAVEACEASFVKSPFGVWIVRIDRLLLRDGRAATIEDFEWARVSGSGGGER